MAWPLTSQQSGAERTASALGLRPMLNKVPEITLYFWIIKILCTTVGETFADFLNVQLNLGLIITTFAMGAALVLVLVVQFTSRQYRPAIYWLAVVLLGVGGTLITDNLTDNFGVALTTTTIIFGIIITLVFTAWYARKSTLSIHAIQHRREGFYSVGNFIHLCSGDGRR